MRPSSSRGRVRMPSVGNDAQRQQTKMQVLPAHRPSLLHAVMCLLSNPANSESLTRYPTQIGDIPRDPTLIILRMGLDEDPRSILDYIHVCGHWRRTVLEDRTLCAAVAFDFRDINLIMTFLRWAGGACQPLRFDTIVSHIDLSLEQKRTVINVLLGDTRRLQNATRIESIQSFPGSNRS